MAVDAAVVVPHREVTIADEEAHDAVRDRDLVRPESPSGASTMDLFYDLYFALTSRSGLWSFDEMADWQRGAGLEPRKPMRLFPGQGIGLQIAQRPAA